MGVRSLFILGLGKQLVQDGLWCGTIDSAVASDTRGPGLKSSRRQLLLNFYIQLILCRKNESNEKEAGNGSFKKHN